MLLIELWKIVPVLLEGNNLVMKSRKFAKSSKINSSLNNLIAFTTVRK